MAGAVKRDYLSRFQLTAKRSQLTGRAGESQPFFVYLQKEKRDGQQG